MNHKDRMLNELPYLGSKDGLEEARMEAKKKVYAFNNAYPDDEDTRIRLLRDLFGKVGANIHVEAPFHCDYGFNIEFAGDAYINYNCTILDVAKVTIGKNAMFAPNVSLYTAGHPLHPEMRNSGYEYGIGITIGDNVWLGGNVVVNPGVHIGNNVVVGSGSVVTKNLPNNVLAAGNPCRVIREITEEDRKFYYKQRLFDIDIHMEC